MQNTHIEDVLQFNFNLESNRCIAEEAKRCEVADRFVKAASGYLHHTAEAARVTHIFAVSWAHLNAHCFESPMESSAAVASPRLCK